jgi:hypothetical protein
VTHPVAGGVVRSSRQAGFGRCSALSVVTAHGVVLSSSGVQGWRSTLRSYASRDGRPLCPGGVSGACLSLSGQVYSAASVLSWGSRWG